MVTLPQSIADLLDEDESDYEETTLQGFRSSWRDLLKWVADSKDDFLDENATEMEGSLPPPTIIAKFLLDRRTLAWSTLKTRRQAIRYVYQELGGTDPFDIPEVEQAWDRIVEQRRGAPTRSGIRGLADRDLSPSDIIENGPGLLRNNLPQETTRQKQIGLQYLPETKVRAENISDEARTIIPEPTFDLGILRDRVVLLLVAMTDLPRKSLLGIDVKDIHPPKEEGDSTRIVITNDLGDATHQLTLKTEEDIRYCPNRAVSAWILAADLTEGALFRPFTPHGTVQDGRIRPQTLNHIIKRRAHQAGFDRSEWSTRRVRGKK